MREEYWIEDKILIIGGLDAAFCFLNNLKSNGYNPKCFKYTFDSNNTFEKKEEVLLTVVEKVAS